MKFNFNRGLNDNLFEVENQISINNNVQNDLVKKFLDIPHIIDLEKWEYEDEFSYRNYSVIFKPSVYVTYENYDYLYGETYFSEDDIDRDLDPVGYIKQLKRKRRALLEVFLIIKNNQKKLLRIRKNILRMFVNFNINRDNRIDLRCILPKYIHLVVDEEEINFIKKQNSFDLLNELIELKFNKIIFKEKWIKIKCLMLLNNYLSKKVCLQKIELV